jgi:glucose/arabinose dehydrogenase
MPVMALFGRVRRSAGLVASALLVPLVALVAASCDETRPPDLGTPVPVALVPEWGLDTRPVAPGCRALAKPALNAAPKAKIAYESLTSAPLANLVDIVAESGRLYVVDRSGVVRILASDGKTAPVVLDLHDQVSFGAESGLVSLAFHPKFAQNGYVYLAYNVPYPTQPPPAGVAFLSVVGRFQSKDGGLTIDKATEKRLLVRDQPTPAHNGDKLVFGNDGYLYFSVGDGALKERAQDTSSLFGKILRLDVDAGDPYAIPPGNPFAQGGGAPEVYAYGFRNPWRISIDKPTGDLWAGDVGEKGFEEIDRVVRGGNYGWPIREGQSCFLAATCDLTGLVEPLAVHPHTEAAAIVGGVVYRGSALPSLVGKYVYADSTFSSFWSLDPNASPPLPVRLDEGLVRGNPTSIGIDEKNELLFVTPTRAFRVVPPAPVQPETPALLSATGCVDPADPTKPVLGLLAYDVNVPQWVDGAALDHYLSIPADAQVVVEPGARLTLPAGGVAMRTLRKEGKRVETQLLLRRPDGSWSAYAYAWQADQKDAVLATAPVSLVLPSGRTHEVRPAECATCHDAHRRGTLTTLGLDAAQLDLHGVDYGAGRTGSPLATLAHNGMLTQPIAPESYSALPSPTGFDTPERRARAYLHGNCAYCHDGVEFSGIDLRAWIPLHDTKTCAVPGGLKTGGVNRLTPGSPDDSQLVTSMRAPVGPEHMPTVGAYATDERGVDLLSSWIRAIATCP